MNKRGIALILSFLVMMVLFVLLSSFFAKSINENNLAKRHVYSMQALWAAEAGVAEAIENLPGSSTNGTIGPAQYQSTTNFRATINACNYYDITSTGIVSVSGGGDVRRTVNVVVKSGPVDSGKFRYGIDAANDLCFGGASCNRDPNDFLDPEICNGGPCWNEFDSTINFADLFGYQQSEVEAIATHYDETNFPGTVSGVTWVDVAAGQTLMATGGLTGSGILIIEGDVQFGGTYQFYGIIYVLGNMTARGTFDNFGGTIVASSVGIDSINGTPDFHYSPSDINDALQQLAVNFVNVVSWKEGP